MGQGNRGLIYFDKLHVKVKGVYSETSENRTSENRNPLKTEQIVLSRFNVLQKTSCDVGMYFGNFRDYSEMIGNYKKLLMPSGKCRVLSVSGRHHDDR